MGAKAAKATYVYCAVQALRKPNLGRAPSGPPGLGTHRLLDGGQGLWLVVADAPSARFGEASIQRGLHDLKWLSRCAVAHEAVVEYCLRARAVVPMKLFTIFESDFRALAEIGAETRATRPLDAARGGGREWGVRIRAVPVPPWSAPRVRSRKSQREPRTWRRRGRCAMRRENWPGADRLE